MAVVPVLPPVATGFYSSSSVSAIVAAVSFVMNKPAAKLRQTVAQSTVTATFLPITFDVEDLDSDPSAPGSGGHSTVTNTSRYTAVYAGWYRCDGAVGYAANVTGVRLAVWFVNGAQSPAGQTVDQATATAANKVGARGDLLYLNVGDYLELAALQTSGGALLTSVVTGEQSSMAVSWDRS